jgi:hypothetical protein
MTLPGFNAETSLYKTSVHLVDGGFGPSQRRRTSTG